MSTKPAEFSVLLNELKKVALAEPVPSNDVDSLTGGVNPLKGDMQQALKVFELKFRQMQGNPTELLEFVNGLGMIPLRQCEDKALISLENALILILTDRSKQAILSELNFQSSNKKL